jgi:anthranilate phosphoribosyltransferase
LRPLLAAAIRLLNVQTALVVNGEDGLGEMTLAGATHVTEVDAAGQREFGLRPEDFGLRTTPLDSLKISGPAESAALVRRVLAAESGPARDIVILNASAGLMTFDGDQTPRDAAARASEAIDSGKAQDLLTRLVELSHVA